ncbi:hypothetical protein ALP66_01397 [Pseudomonas amygdali pv. photiniae]|nr:hypothetical protein ALP66_01397 [Pseudomonas amygdali pv. photiniae]
MARCPKKTFSSRYYGAFKKLARVLLYPLYNKNKNTQQPNKNNTYRL